LVAPSNSHQPTTDLADLIPHRCSQLAVYLLHDYKVWWRQRLVFGCDRGWACWAL